MTDILQISLLVIASACVITGLNHLSLGLQRRLDLVHLLFAGMCFLMAPFAFTHALVLKATNVHEFIHALKWNLAISLLFLGLFPWFISEHTETRKHALPLLTVTSILFAFLFVVNLSHPFSLQYSHLNDIRALQLPWGEIVTQGVGDCGIWQYIYVIALIIAYGYVITALVDRYRRLRRGTDLAMLLGVGVCLLTTVQGTLVQLSVLNFIEFSPFGYLFMIIIMSIACCRDIQSNLQDSERRIRSLIEQLPFGIQLATPDGFVRQTNAFMEKLLGVKTDGHDSYNILQDEQFVKNGLMPYIERGFASKVTTIPPIIFTSEVHGTLRDRWVQSYIYPIKDLYGAITDVVLIYEDVTDKKHFRFKDELRIISAGVSSENGESFFQKLTQNLAKLFDAEYCFIGETDESNDGRINTIAVCAHGQIVDNFSYDLADTPCANVVGKHTCTYARGVQQLFPKDLLLVDMGIEGYIGTPLYGALGQSIGLLVVLDSKPLENIDHVQEILEIFAARAGSELQHMRAQKHIRHMAYYDYLTGLANRAHLHEHLSKTLREVRINREVGALLLIDLDHFKTINDALSHDVGDEVLRAVAQRLNDVVAGRALVARMGGDEFVVLQRFGELSIATAEQLAHELATQLQEKLISPLFVGDRAFNIGASIGIVLFPRNDEHEPDIMRHADMALYRAKHLGRGNIQFYTPEMHDTATNRLQLEEGLRRAIGNNELEIYFQPQVNIGGQCIGAEVLLRWHHPELGDIPPSEFIPIAEETGLIHSIGSWVLDQACSKFADWQKAGIPFTGHISINVCVWQFVSSDFTEQVQQALTKYKIDSGRLMLELTESALLSDTDDAVEKLNALRAMGIKVSLDDFGTGYSSLSYLRILPLDQIKIDKSFIDELSSDVEHPLVESIIAISQHMKLPIVAEGVETKTQRDILTKLGCQIFQGYLYCRPISEKDFLKWLAAR